MSLMCEVNFSDLVELDLDDESHSDSTDSDVTYAGKSEGYCDSSEAKSDTEFEGEITLEWHHADYSNFVSSKYMSMYLESKLSTIIITIIDHHQKNWEKYPKVFYLPIIYKPKLNAKQQLKRYCGHSDRKTIVDDIFTSVPYDVLTTNVKWPGVVPRPTQYPSVSPFYCLNEHKSLTTPLHKEQQFYNLFALKLKFHKLYTCPGKNLKFCCHPSEQWTDFKVDSSALFRKHPKQPVLRFNYKFLESTKNPNAISEQDATSISRDQSSNSNSESTDIESDSTIIYDSKSYLRSSAPLSSDRDLVFFKQTETMHCKILTKHSVAMKNLMSNELQEIIDDDDINMHISQLKCTDGQQNKVTDRFSLNTSIAVGGDF